MVDKLREKLEPFIRFIDTWDAKPLGGIADEFYAIHTSTQYEASLRLSDFRKLREAAAALPDAEDQQ